MFAQWKRGKCIVILILVTLNGCGILDTAQNDSQVATAAVQTYQAQQTNDASLKPVDTATSAPTLEPTLAPTLTLTLTATLEPTFTPTITPSPTVTPDPGWPGRWTFFVLMISSEFINVDLVQEGDRITTTIYGGGGEYYVSGVVDAGGGQVTGAVYEGGVMRAYFVWEMQPGRNLFLGRWWHGVQSGAWCGGRRGVTPPPEDQCLLRP